MTNGLYNYPYHIKQYLLNKCLLIQKKYIDILNIIINSNNNNNLNNNNIILMNKKV